MASESREKNSDKKVVVALTGRVDSAVAAFLLKKQGYQVIGLSIIVSNDDIVNDKTFLPKCHIVDLEKVKEFCDKIKIPFYATDAKSKYENDVIDTLVSKKLTGRANTSCFDCTQMRMEVLYNKMIALEADFIATGHYCKVYKNLNSDEFFIHSNGDVKSDQSFLLAGLDQKYLQHLLLPLGELRNEEVGKISRNFGLLADKSLVQDGFCFKLKESTDKLISSKVPKSLIKEGQVLNGKTDSNLGDHHGMVHHYITEKEFPFVNGGSLDRNLEIVDYNYSKGQIIAGDKTCLSFSGTQVVNLIIAKGLNKTRPVACFIKFKYSANFVKGNLFFKNNQTAYLDFEEDVYPLIKGESMVLYDSNQRNSKIIGYAQVGARGNFEPIDRVKAFKRVNPNETEEEGNNAKNKISIFKF